MLTIAWEALLGFGVREADDGGADLGSAVLPPSVAARDDARARIAAMGERLVGMIAGRVLPAPDDAAALAEIDAVLHAGILPRYLRPIVALLEAADPPPLSEMSEMSLSRAPNVDPRAIDALREGMQIIAKLMPALRRAQDELPDSASGADAHLLQAGRDPLRYLSELPVELAELLLAAERGQVAYWALEGVLAGSWFEVPAGRDVFLANLYRGGMLAQARLLAAARPDLVPEALVPPSERLDLAQLHAAHEAAEERLAALLAAADASGEAVFEPGDDA